MQVIIFQINGFTAVMTVTEGLDLLQVGQKDVPDGTPFWFIDNDLLPGDIPQEEWIMDFTLLGEPSGYGGDVSTD
ncbi:hypothetical protein ACM26X_15410 [Kluyvera cryocrescens]|uniref:hypothetical protein n=1 Tax=Kluyvera cryocrescens TaxID=580 RepID=UPI0039F5CAE4